MVGRPRKRAASTSTVATVDENTIQYHRELGVLKTVETTDSDEWDCFLLKDAVVYHRNGQLANLLNVDFEGPFVVRGRLDLDDDQRSRLIRGQAKSANAWIEITNSHKYAIGTLEGHEIPILWAQGEAGWYEIVPSDRYSNIYTNMVQAISLHYGVLSQLEAELESLEESERSKPKGKRRRYRLQDINLHMQHLLFRYAVKIGDGATHEEVLERCRVHSAFLLSHFPKNTGFHNWLKSEFPQTTQKLDQKDFVTAPAANIGPVVPILPRPKSSSVEGIDAKGKGKAVQRPSAQRSTRSSKQVESEVIDLTNENSRNQCAKSVTKTVMSRRRSPSHTQDDTAEQRDVDMRDFAAEPATVPSPENSPGPSTSGGYIEAGLPTLIDVLNEVRRNAAEDFEKGTSRKHPDQLTATSYMTKVYMACRVREYHGKLELFQYFASRLLRELGSEWHQSELYKWFKQNARAKPAFQFITKDECKFLLRRQKAHQTTAKDAKVIADKGKKSAEHSGKQPPGRPSGKQAGLRPSLGGKKRLRNADDEDEMDVDADLHRRKTAKTSQYFPKMDSDEQLDAVSSSDDEHADRKEPLRRIVIHAEKLPSATPKGPNHTWNCEEPDCEYVVRGADKENGKELIRQHFERHEKEASDEAKERELSKINLAMQESRGHMPINHLLDKIRKATVVQKRDDLTINGRVVPQPIKRSLLV